MPMPPATAPYARTAVRPKTSSTTIDQFQNRVATTISGPASHHPRRADSPIVTTRKEPGIIAPEKPTAREVKKRVV
jgi:hypothetical protein